VLGAPAAARAGTYDVRSCGANSAQAFTLANESPQTIDDGIVCPQAESQLLSGMYAGVAKTGFTLARTGASWTIAAPPGLELQRLDVTRALGRVSTAWQVTAATPARVLEACDKDDPAACRLGSAGGEAKAYTDLNASSVTFRLECHPPAPDEDLACVGRSTTQAWVAIYGATARVDDPAPPELEPLAVTRAGTTASSRSTSPRPMRAGSSRCACRPGRSRSSSARRSATTPGCNRARGVCASRSPSIPPRSPTGPTR
jgi:hypothetical protein